MPLPGEPRQWLEVKLPGDDPMDKALTWGAWIVLSLLLTATLLLLWALPVWRDMDALRNAALRMGQGDLGIRVRLAHRRHSPHRRNLQPDGLADLGADREPAQHDQRRFPRTAYAAGAAVVRTRPAGARRGRAQARPDHPGHARGHRGTAGHGGRTAGLRPPGTARRGVRQARDRGHARLAEGSAGAGRLPGRGPQRAMPHPGRLPGPHRPASALHEPRAAEPGAERRALCRRARARLGHGLPRGRLPAHRRRRRARHSGRRTGEHLRALHPPGRQPRPGHGRRRPGAGDRQAGGGQPQWQHRSLRQPAGGARFVLRWPAGTKAH